MTAIAAAGKVEPETALTAMGQEVESRILPLVETSGPEIPPVAKNAVDCRFYAVTLNTLENPVNFHFRCNDRTRFIYFVQQYLFS